MEELLTIEELVEKLDEEEKRKLPWIFFINILLSVLLITGAFVIIGFTGYYFNKAETVMEQYEIKEVEYNGDIYKTHLIDEMQVLLSEYDQIRETAVRFLVYLLLYCAAATIVIHLFHRYINEHHWYYDEDVFHHLRKKKKNKV